MDQKTESERTDEPSDSVKLCNEDIKSDSKSFDKRALGLIAIIFLIIICLIYLVQNKNSNAVINNNVELSDGSDAIASIDNDVNQEDGIVEGASPNVNNLKTVDFNFGGSDVSFTFSNGVSLSDSADPMTSDRKGVLVYLQGYQLSYIGQSNAELAQTALDRLVVREILSNNVVGESNIISSCDCSGADGYLLCDTGAIDIHIDASNSLNELANANVGYIYIYVNDSISGLSATSMLQIKY